MKSTLKKRKTAESAAKSKKRRVRGSIEQRLRSLYPSHLRLKQSVRALAELKCVQLEDLRNLAKPDAQAALPMLFLLALRRYLSDDSILGREVTVEMSLKYSVSTVTLQKQNYIPQMEEAYDPMFKSPAVEIEELMKEGPALENEVEEEELEDDDDDEEASTSGADPPDATTSGADPPHEQRRAEEETETAPFSLQLYDFGNSGFVFAVWPKSGPLMLLEREHYPKILSKVRQLWDGGMTAVMLTGTPGIGKSAFLIYVLVTLMKEGVPIVFRTKDGTYFFFEPPPRSSGEGYKWYRLTDYSVIMDRLVYILADGKLVDPPVFIGNTLLASAPVKKDARHYRLILPVWSSSEIALAWQEIFDPNAEVCRPDGEEMSEEMSEDDEQVQEQAGCIDGGERDEQVQGNPIFARRTTAISCSGPLTLDIVKERYRTWGGTPRFVLERPDSKLGVVIDTLPSIRTVFDGAGKELVDADHPSHKMAHMKVRPGYEAYEYMFASAYVMEQKLKNDTSENLKAFLSFKGLVVKGLKGHIFQRLLMEKTVGSQTMMVRRLFQDIKKSTSATSRRKVFAFKDVSRPFCWSKAPASHLPPNRMIWFESKTEGTFDALRIVRRKGRKDILELFQATISSSRNQHGLKYKAVLGVMEHLEIDANRTRMYICTTSEMFAQAGYQKWLEPGGKVLTDAKILERLAPISQYAMDAGF